MNTYTVHKILQHDFKQLLLIRVNDYEFSLAVYNEHTGQTLMRLTACTIDEFKRAIEILESPETDPIQMPLSLDN